MMKKTNLFLWINLLLTCVCFTGCTRSSDDTWDDTKSAGRYIGRGFRALTGSCEDSRQVRYREEFMCDDDPYGDQNDFIPLQDDNRLGREDSAIPAPANSPGDPGSPVPGITSFRSPDSVPGAGHVFRNISFDYKSSLVKGDDNRQKIRMIADYMASHPNVYIFVEGHCDERGPEAYNYALGTHRSNEVRAVLVKEGVSSDRIFTTTYGKDRPLVLGSNEEAWALNRRAEFKIYQR